MKHATPATIDALADVLDRVRARPELKERTHGSFYRKSSGFLHFHEDPAGLFADVKGPAGWERVQVDSQAQRRALFKRIEGLLA
jgi:hypothetical protein